MKKPYQRGYATRSDTSDALVSDLVTGEVPQPLTKSEYELLLRIHEIGDEVLTAENYELYDATPLEDDDYKSIRWKMQNSLIAGKPLGGDIIYSEIPFSRHYFYDSKAFEQVYLAVPPEFRSQFAPAFHDYYTNLGQDPLPSGWWLYTLLSIGDLHDKIEQLIDPATTIDPQRRRRIIEDMRDKDGDGNEDPAPPEGGYGTTDDPQPPPGGPKGNGDDAGGSWSTTDDGAGGHLVEACYTTAKVVYNQPLGRGIFDIITGVQFIPYGADYSNVGQIIAQEIAQAEGLNIEDFDLIWCELAFDGVATKSGEGTFAGKSIELPINFVEKLPELEDTNQVQILTWPQTREQEFGFNIAGNSVEFVFRVWEWETVQLGSDANPIGPAEDFNAFPDYYLMAAPLGVRLIDDFLKLRANAYQIALKCYKIRKTCRFRLPFRYNFKNWPINRDCWADGRPGPVTMLAGLLTAQSDRFGSPGRGILRVSTATNGATLTCLAKHSGHAGGYVEIVNLGNAQAAIGWFFPPVDPATGYLISTGVLDPASIELQPGTDYGIRFVSAQGLTMFYVQDFEIRLA